MPHIYAAGDVIGFPSLASTSMEQGRVAACHAFGVPLPPPPETFPYGIYAVPEISTVGQSEEQVRDSGIAYEGGMARFRETSRGHIMGVDSGFLKLIFALDTRRLLGAHIVGEGATELIHIGQAVINLGGTVDYFVNNTFNYPTLAEAYKIAGLDAWNRMGQRVGRDCLPPTSRKIMRSIRRLRLIAQSGLFALFGAPIGDGPLRIDFARSDTANASFPDRALMLSVICGSTAFASVSRARRLGHRGEVGDAAGQFFRVAAIRQRPMRAQEFLYPCDNIAALRDPHGSRLGRVALASSLLERGECGVHPRLHFRDGGGYSVDEGFGGLASRLVALQLTGGFTRLTRLTIGLFCSPACVIAAAARSAVT